MKGAEILAKLKRLNIVVGPDARVHEIISHFNTATGRANPGPSTFPYSFPAALRHIIGPVEDNEVYLYCDFGQQEFYLQSFFAQDELMKQAYDATEDTYLAIAKAVGAAPARATVESHPEVRRTFKVLSLGIAYGRTAIGVASELKITEFEAYALIEKFFSSFPKLRQWVELVHREALSNRELHSLLGWKVKFPTHTRLSPRVSKSADLSCPIFGPLKIRSKSGNRGHYVRFCRVQKPGNDFSPKRAFLDSLVEPLSTARSPEF